MQSSFVDPSLWTPSSSYGTATAFSRPAAGEPRASFDLSNAPAEQLENPFDQLLNEWIKIQECAPPENSEDSESVEGIHFDFSDVDTSRLDEFIPPGYHGVPETIPQGTLEEWFSVFDLQPCTPSLSHQDSSPSSPSISVPSSPSSSASSSASKSPSPPRSRSLHSPYSAGKRSVTQPSRNAQIAEHTKPKPARANECRYCHCRFGRPADVTRHEKTHFIGDYQYACLGLPVEEAGECDDADIANGFMHDGKLMVHGCLTTFKDRRDSYRRHLATRGCPGSKAGYWANVREVADTRAKRKANGY
ncbi:hypothetical protein V8D89_006863 [Ganoderma adspersum]